MFETMTAAALVIGALALALAVGYRHRAYTQYVEKRDEVARLRRELAQIQAEKQALDAERAAIRRERETLARHEPPNVAIEPGAP